MNYLTKILVINGRAIRNHEFLGISSQILNNSRFNSDDVRFLPRTEPANLKRGRGGRSSFSGVVATVFGATGFIGKYVVNRLGKTGTQMILPYRGDFHFAKDLKVSADLGQVLFLPFHLCDEDAIRKAVKYSNVVINLMGRDFNTRRFTFHQVHVEGAERLARICKEMGVEKFIHVSALNSNFEHKGYFTPGGSLFLKTKGESEEAVKQHYPDAIIFRPSDVWGQEDRFTLHYCRYFRYTFSMTSLINGGEGIWKQPVYVADLAQGIVNAAYSHDAIGTTYEAVGPRRYELGELVDWINRVLRREGEWGYKRFDMKWDPLIRIKAKLNDFNPSHPINTVCFDKIEREGISDTTFDLPTLEDLGITLTKMEDRLAWELKRFKYQGYYCESVGEYAPPAPPKFVEP